MLSRRILLGSIAAPAVVLAAVSLAWACVPQGTFTLNPTQGAAGSQVAASGSGFETGEPVEIRFESRTGPILATTTGPSFTNVPVTIPASADAGIHYLSAANTGEHGDHSATAASFEVTAAAAPAGPPAPPPPAPPTPPDPPSAASKRAKAIALCKRKYSTKRAKTAANRKRMAKKQKTCIKKAKKLPAGQATSFNFASLPLFG